MHNRYTAAIIIGNHSYYRLVLAMYICLCKAVTDSDIKRAIESGAESFSDVRESLGVGTVCGSCACQAKELVKATAKHSGGADNTGLFFALA